MDLCCLKFICCLHCICIVELWNYIDVCRCICINYIILQKTACTVHALHNIYTAKPKNNGHCPTCAVCRIRALGQLILDCEMGVSKGADLMKGANFGRQLWMFSWEGCGFQKSTNRNLLNAILNWFGCIAHNNLNIPT